MQKLLLLKYLQKTLFINEIIGHYVTINLNDDLSILKHVQIFEVHYSYHNTIFLNYFKPCYCGFRITMKENNPQHMLINVSLGMTWWAYIVTTNSFKALISFLILTLSFECYNRFVFFYFCFTFLPTSHVFWFIINRFHFYFWAHLNSTWSSKYNDHIGHCKGENMT